MKKNSRLYYNKPATPTIWEEALPLGNGFLGGMVYGGVSEEIIKLNQESVWYGSFRNRINPNALESLDNIRKKIFEGSLAEAEEIAYTKMFGAPMSQGHYEPLADLKISFNQTIAHHSEIGIERNKDYSSYERILSLEESVYSSSYTINNQHFDREIFISYPDKVMAVKLVTNEEGNLSFRVELERNDMYERIYVQDNHIILEGVSGGNGTKFIAVAKVIAKNGNVEAAGGTIKVSGATEAELLITGSTDFYGYNPYDWCMEVMEKATNKGYSALKKDHIEDYQSLYMRVSLDLGEVDNNEGKTTDKRLKELKEFKEHANKADNLLVGEPVNKSDAKLVSNGLIELYFNYGRYLLISCSRKGSLPANLQGIWNKDMQPPWGCKYTININTEMNYWPAEVTNLSECHQPLFDHLRRMALHGKEVAMKMYGCRGIMAHHNTDIYGDCAPQDQWMPATIWPMGMAWLVTHLVEHYRFNKDTEFIEEYYELIKDTSLFFVDFLVKDKNNQLVTCPTTSPENTYLLSNGEKSALCYGPTMDSQIIRHLWEGFLEISFELNKSNTIIDTLKAMIVDLPTEKIGSKGQLLEWTVEYEEWERGHRHISHLYGLYPGNTIASRATPELFEAAKITLKERLESGGGHTGWSRAWIINFYARLFDGNEALKQLEALLDHSTADNLFDMHPPFQIDGNFGGTAGIAEMLLQSHEDLIRLLPALPAKWENGHIKGLKARNNIEVELWWSKGKIEKARFTSPYAQKIVVSYGSDKRTIELEKGVGLTLDCLHIACN